MKPNKTLSNSKLSDLHAELEISVKEDLKKIETILKNYDSSKFIDNYKPNNHQEGKVFDFYKRCCEEKEKIENYLNSGISDRVEQKLQYVEDFNLDLSYSINQAYLDKPYRIWLPNAESYFDYKKINCFRHRLSSVPLRDKNGKEIVKEISQLYSQDKQKFYNELEKYIPKLKIFEIIKEKFIEFPFLKERLDIICELELNFKDKRWNSFVALSIVQLEGLFSEMLKIINNKIPTTSMPDKVAKVRLSYYLHEINFDYYQYYFPEIRNKFTHYGILTEINLETTAYDLLYDLCHILEVFEELETPLLVLMKILKTDSRDIKSIQDYNYLFRLVYEARQKFNQEKAKKSIQFDEIMSKWSDFEIKLSSNSNLIIITSELEKSIDKSLSLFLSNFNSYSEIVFSDWQTIQKYEKEIVEIINSNYNLNCMFLKLCEDIYFIKSFKSNLINCPPNIKEIIMDIGKRNEEIFKKINFFSYKIKTNT